MAKAFVKHDYAVTGRDYVETEGGDTPAGGGVNYSTDEQDTGLTWIDGSKIYQKTFEYNYSSSVADWTLFDESIAYGILVDYKMIRYQTEQTTPVFPDMDASNIVRFTCKSGKLYYFLGSNTACAGYVTMYYTKTE